MTAKRTRAIYRPLLLSLTASVFTVARLASAADVPEVPCSYYASPDGAGDGKSVQTPFRVASFWRLAKPGDTICLEDGRYVGADSMISPPRELAGRADHPITVQALNDGKVLVDGQSAHRPIALSHNDWFVVQGVNACCSSETVVEVMRASHNVIRRVAAWDAAEGNNFIFGIHYGDHNLLEDVAGWGIARKIFTSSQEGNFTVIRRGWGRWEGSHVIGPKTTYELSYNSHGMTLENCIGTWSGEKMNRTYVILDYHGKPSVGREANYQNYDVNQPYGIFSVTGEKNPRARLLGSIAYITAGDSFKPQHLILVTRVDSAVEIADTLAYIEPGYQPRVRTFGLYGLTASTDRSGAVELSASNITSFGGAGASLGKDWDTRNVLQGTSPAVYGSTENVFNTTRGANLCFRYVDGARTTRPLWPWPMNQRITDAMTQAGRQPVDITATIERILGPIPQECRSPIAKEEPSDLVRPPQGPPSPRH